MDRKKLQNFHIAFNENNIKEDQWVVELYIALKSMFNSSENRVFCQASNEVHPDFVGEIDLYVENLNP